MPKIAVDIDETLYSFDSAVRNAFFDMAEEYNDKSLLRMAYSNNYEWRNLVDHDKKSAYEAIERVHSQTNKYQLFPDVHRVMWDIKFANHDILYIGSRKDIHYDVTEEALFFDWALPHGELICADPQKSKNAYLKDCQYLIDDRPKTIFEFLYDNNWTEYALGYSDPNEFTRKAFALWRPYNQNLTELRNLLLAPTWRGLEYYLKRKGVIR